MINDCSTDRVVSRVLEAQVQGKKVTSAEGFEDWLEALVQGGNSAVPAARTRSSEPRRRALVRQLLGQPLTRTTAQIVGALHEAGFDHSAEVERLLSQLRPRRHHPYLAWQICRYLLARGVRQQECISVLRKFSRQRVVRGYRGNPFDYEMAVLALEYDPGAGIAFLRRSLRSKTPWCVQVTAALLAVIDEDWSRHELWTALEEEQPACDQFMVVHALRQSADRATRTLADRRRVRPPRRPADATAAAYDDMLERRTEEFFRRARKRAESDLPRLSLRRIGHAARNAGQPSEPSGWLQRIFAPLAT